MKDLNGDEADGMDETILPVDYKYFFFFFFFFSILFNLVVFACYSL